MNKIKICDGLYITDCGKLFNDTKELSLYEDKDGYLLYRHKNLISPMIHRCVYYYFNNCNIPEGLQIDHIDRNKKNNNINNLRAVSCTKNLLNKDTYKIVLIHNMINKKTYITDNIARFSRENNLDRTNLYSVLHKKVKQYKNWICKEIKYSTDEIDFIKEISHTEYDLSDIMTAINNRYATIIATNIDTGKIYKFSDKINFANTFNISVDCIRKCLCKKQNQTKGFKFEYDYSIEIKGKDIVEIS